MERVPTCHRASYDSVFDDIDYIGAVNNADPAAVSLYKKEAARIDRIQKGILEISKKEKPFDIFICYKETDSQGNRTLESVKAQEIYDMLTDKGYKVFFSRITLEDKLGQAYEPYIFAALNSARIMLVITSDPDNVNAVWVKNEWSRFLKIMQRKKDRALIPCYLNISPYELPEEFSYLQAQDLGKLMVELMVKNREDLKDYPRLFDEKNNYQRIMRYGNDDIKAEVQGYTQCIKDRLRMEYNESVYKKALDVYDYPGSKKKDITKAKEQFESIDSL